jgi:hypothetical protein
MRQRLIGEKIEDAGKVLNEEISQQQIGEYGSRRYSFFVGHRPPYAR